MKIQLGTIYINRTKTYLVPILCEHGKTFEDKVANMFKLAMGLGDFALIEMGLVIKNSVFILIDTKFTRTKFKENLNWIRCQKYYKFDYPFDDVHTGHLHMIVVSIPEKYNDSLLEFHTGRYSKMYNYQDVRRFFQEDKDEFKVLTKNPEMLITFVDKINNMFKTNVEYDTFGGEYDFTLKDEDEYFNAELYPKQE